MSAFASRLQAHLSGYKRGRLGISEDGVWVKNGRAYGHILPVAIKQHNICEPIRDAFWRYAEQKSLVSQLHRDFHHLSSSQAMAFNLFFTFFGMPWSEPRILLNALRVSDKDIASFAFESIPDEDEATNFDFVASFTDGTRLLVEVKLSESAFGTCKDDAQHRAKRDTIYRARLAGKVYPDTVESDKFFTEYQLLRNVSHLGDGDALVILGPRANSGTFAHAERFRKEVLTDETRPAVRVVALEDLLDALSTSDGGPQTRGMITALIEKYLVPAA